MCQGCVAQGHLSQATFDAIERFLEQWPDAEFGPTHIVLGDDNVDDASIRYCLGEIEKLEPTEELDASKAFLDSLLAIPEDER